MLEIVRALPDQIKGALDLAKHIKVNTPKNIIFCGVGGSGISGNIIQRLIGDCKVPLSVIKNYHLPGWVNEESLVFCISYSGNTEETVSCFKEALKRKSQIVLVTSNGKLTLLAQKLDFNNIVRVPYRLPPRTALAYLIFPILMILNDLKLISISSKDVADTINALKKEGYDEKAQELARQLKDHIPLIYTSPTYEGVALRWKQEFNENTKIHAFYNVFPELDHNELMAYKRTNKELFVVILSDEDEEPQIRKRIELTKEIIKQAGNKVLEVHIKGTSKLVKTFTAIYLGDLTSVHLAKLYNTDPMNADLIEELKKRLSGL
ncbi:bifunctional phosphoglucose/phosphomannose isomerase [archaeon]|nr:bifunctional phosphoglucose/phosphomannose isomerase [archaeon]